MADIQSSIAQLAEASARIADEAVLVSRLDAAVREHDASVELLHRTYVAGCETARDRLVQVVKQIVQEIRENQVEPDYPEYDDEEDD